jgi:beta-carotene 3-hydroxylase
MKTIISLNMSIPLNAMTYFFYIFAIPSIATSYFVPRLVSIIYFLGLGYFAYGPLFMIHDVNSTFKWFKHTNNKYLIGLRKHTKCTLKIW